MSALSASIAPFPGSFSPWLTTNSLWANKAAERGSSGLFYAKASPRHTDVSTIFCQTGKTGIPENSAAAAVDDRAAGIAHAAVEFDGFDDADRLARAGFRDQRGGHPGVHAQPNPPGVWVYQRE